MLKAPFILVEANGDISVYRTIATLAQGVEPIDVKTENLRVFDSLGNRVDLRVECQNVSKLPWFLGGGLRREEVHPVAMDAAPEPEELRLALATALAQVSPLSKPGVNSLEGLLSLAIERFGLE